jgi:hypothetical protein
MAIPGVLRRLCTFYVLVAIPYLPPPEPLWKPLKTQKKAMSGVGVGGKLGSRSCSAIIDFVKCELTLSD